MKISTLNLLTVTPLLSCMFLGVSAQKQPQPNLIFIFPDQMRAQSMGFVGEEKVKTPVIDRFAGESIYFSNAVSNYPVCSPTRAMIMTGQYPLRNKVFANCTSATAKFGCELPETAKCWSDVLKDHGYSLGYIGKWHLDSPHEPFVNTSNNLGEVKWNEWCPKERRHGFSFWHAYGTYDQHLRPMYWDTEDKREDFKYYDEWGPEHEANRAIDYIQNKNGNLRESGKPFALVISMNPPHTAYDQVPQKYKDLYKDMSVETLITKPNIPAAGTKWGDHYRKNIKDYYACISGVDEQFGRILRALKDAGLEENTIVVFTSDHGDCLGMHEEVTKNNPYEESMRVPLLIRFPATLKPRHDNILISTPDLYPTLLGLMNLASSIPSEVDGTDYSKYLIRGKGAKPSSQWYMKVDNASKESGIRGVRTDRYTYVVNKKNGEKNVMLFDRKNDPYQLTNIATENPKLTETLDKELVVWLKKYNDPWLYNMKN
ncbi:MAG: sulfatase [Prolixibacteraceae bacterium]|nr:sulfatase [Prolixibacteraceae bacterium]